MPNDFVTSLPVWLAVKQALDEERSALVLGPRHYRKTWLLRQLGLFYQEREEAQCSFLELTEATGRRSLDYSRLFNSMAKQLAYRSRAKIQNALSFAEGLRRILAERSQRTILLIRGGESGAEDAKFEMLASLRDVLMDEFMAESRKLSVVVTDDYSLWHHQRYGPLVSELHCFQKIYVYPLGVRDIVRSLKSFQAQQANSEGELDYEVLGKRIFEATGGHLGLASEAFDSLTDHDWKVDDKDWPDELRDRLGRSPLFARIQRAIQEAPSGLAETALEYLVPDYPVELRSSRVQLLLQLGILQLTPLGQLVLCPGLIREMIETISRAGSLKMDRLGIIVGESGPTAFEAGGVELEDDDMVVVHLSDLHVGIHHQFQYRDRNGNYFNTDRSSLTDLLARDLKELQLLGRIDALVVSGDFAENGKDPEFRTARIILEDLLKKLELPLDRLLILPGNHDVDWGDPPQSQDLVWNGPGSRIPFDDFAEHFQHAFGGGAVLRLIPSRSNRRRLCIVALDSNKVEGKKASGIGYVSHEALDLATKLLGSAQEENVEDLIWVSVHHHIFPATSIRLEEAQRAKVTVMANAAEILAHATSWGAEVILHGHEHQPSVTIARRWPTDAAGKHFVPVISIGAGSVGAEQKLLGPFGRNQYFVLYRRKKDLILRSRCLGEAGIAFVAQNDMIVPLNTGEKGREVREKGRVGGGRGGREKGASRPSE